MQQGEVVVTLSSVPFPHVPGTFTIITAPQWIYLFFLGTIHSSFVTNKLAIHKLRRATYFLLAETPSPPCETVLAFRDVVFFCFFFSREEIEQTQLVDPVKSLPSATLSCVAEQHPITQGNWTSLRGPLLAPCNIYYHPSSRDFRSMGE